MKTMCPPGYHHITVYSFNCIMILRVVFLLKDTSIMLVNINNINISTSPIITNIEKQHKNKAATEKIFIKGGSQVLRYIKRDKNSPVKPRVL